MTSVSSQSSGAPHTPPDLKTILDIPVKLSRRIFLKAIFSSDDPRTVYDSLSRVCKSWREICIEKGESKILHLFGVHVAPEAKISFFNTPTNPNLVRAEVKNHFVSVKIQDSSANTTLSSSTDKICQFLRNSYLCPVYVEAENEVRFVPIPPPENKTWSVHRELQLPDSDSSTPFVCRSNGTISYASINKIITWDWENNKSEEERSLPTSDVTALAELESGDLIAGDKAGRIYVRKFGLIDLKQESAISEILIINADHCAVQIENGASLLIDMQNGKILRTFDKETKVCVFKQGHLAVLSDKVVQVIQIPNNKIVAEHKFDEKCTMIKPASDSLLIVQGAQIIIWNVRLNTFQIIKVPVRSQHFIFLRPKTLILWGTSSKRDVFLTRFCDGESSDFKQAGYWRVSSMILLSDGSIMYGTGTGSSGIHVVTKEGKVVFSNTELANNENIKSLTELVNGSVAVKFQNSIRIIKPCKKALSATNYYQIDKLKLELRYAPDQLDLYLQLAQLYDEVKDTKSLYNIYLAGLEAAVKSGNLYQARRLYEKARKNFPDRKDPIRLFLFYLEQTPHKKLKRRIQLDWYEFQKKYSGEQAPLINSRKYKERLFIGECDFSYTEAMINKHSGTHKQLPQSIIATELSELKGETAKQRVDTLEKKGVRVLSGIDGEKVHELFKDKRIKRIHWNCPFGGANYNERERFKTVIPNFFRSCSQLQLPGDRIHVTLMRGWMDKDGDVRQRENPIVLGSVRAGYRLIRKRNFGSERYPGYKHAITGGREYKGGGKECEFVFEKADPLTISHPIGIERAKALRNPQEKRYEITTKKNDSEDLRDYYFECSTDEDSSDYYASDEELDNEPFFGNRY